MVREEQNSAGHIGEGEGEGAGAARHGACLDVGIPATLVPMPNACPLRTRDHEPMPLGRAPSHDITRPLRFLIPAVEHDDQAAGISTRLVGGHIHAEFTPPITHRYRHVRVAHRQRTCCCHGGEDEHCATCSGTIGDGRPPRLIIGYSVHLYSTSVPVPYCSYIVIVCRYMYPIVDSAPAQFEFEYFLP